MKRDFHNREDETRRLTRFLTSGSNGLVVVYGRRRCGKSTLLQRILSSTEHTYFQADQREVSLQLGAFAAALANQLPDFDKVKYRTWDELLASLYARANRMLCICLDEFPYLVQADPPLPSVLQRYIDRTDGKVAWFLCGSSQRMMNGLVLDKKAPLYGRAREIIKIEPLSAGWLMPALGVNALDGVKAYATWGGVPRYWELASEYDTQEDALEDLVWNPRGVLHEEASRLLSDDLRSAVQPYSILSLIGTGCNRPSEISARLEKHLSALARPLSQLCELNYVRRDVPFGESPKKSRHALYRLKDSFLRFFFRFVLPYESSLAQGLTVEATRSWRRDREHFFGACWEDLCRMAVPWIEEWDTPFGAASAWWQRGRKQSEIDIAAHSLDRQSILVGECKWSDGRSTLDLTSLDVELRRKAAQSPATAGKRIITSCWHAGGSPTTGRIDRLIGPDAVMSALTR